MTLRSHIPQPRPGDPIRARDTIDLGRAIQRNQIDFDPSHFEVVPAGPGRIVRARRPTGAGTAIIHALAKWNSGSSAYDWQEAHYSAGSWVQKSGGLSTGGYTSDTGTGNMALAVHEAGLQDLPDGIHIRIELHTDSSGDIQPIFQVPLQLDASFVHRTALTGTPTLGNRADYTFTQSELQNDAITLASATSIEGQGSSIGWVKTEVWVPNIYEAGGDKTLYGYAQDIEYDVLGRYVSESQAWRFTLSAADPCT